MTNFSLTRASNFFKSFLQAEAERQLCQRGFSEFDPKKQEQDIELFCGWLTALIQTAINPELQLNVSDSSPFLQKKLEALKNTEDLSEPQRRALGRLVRATFDSAICGQKIEDSPSRENIKYSDKLKDDITLLMMVILDEARLLIQSHPSQGEKPDIEFDYCKEYFHARRQNPFAHESILKSRIQDSYSDIDPTLCFQLLSTMQVVQADNNYLTSLRIFIKNKPNLSTSELVQLMTNLRAIPFNQKLFDLLKDRCAKAEPLDQLQYLCILAKFSEIPQCQEIFLGTIIDGLAYALENSGSEYDIAGIVKLIASIKDLQLNPENKSALESHLATVLIDGDPDEATIYFIGKILTKLAPLESSTQEAFRSFIQTKTGNGKIQKFMSLFLLPNTANNLIQEMVRDDISNLDINDDSLNQTIFKLSMILCDDQSYYLHYNSPISLLKKLEPAQTEIDDIPEIRLNLNTSCTTEQLNKLRNSLIQKLIQLFMDHKNKALRKTLALALASLGKDSVDYLFDYIREYGVEGKCELEERYKFAILKLLDLFVKIPFGKYCFDSFELERENSHPSTLVQPIKLASYIREYMSENIEKFQRLSKAFYSRNIDFSQSA